MLAFLDISVKLIGLFSSELVAYLNLSSKGKDRFLSMLVYCIYTICDQFCMSLSLSYPL